MDALRGLLGLVLLLGIAVLASRDRRGIRWRTVGVALAVQVVFAFLVLRTRPGQAVLDFLSRRVETLIATPRAAPTSSSGPWPRSGRPTASRSPSRCSR